MFGIREVLAMRAENRAKVVRLHTSNDQRCAELRTNIAWAEGEVDRMNLWLVHLRTELAMREERTGG